MAQQMIPHETRDAVAERESGPQIRILCRFGGDVFRRVVVDLRGASVLEFISGSTSTGAFEPDVARRSADLDFERCRDRGSTALSAGSSIRMRSDRA